MMLNISIFEAVSILVIMSLIGPGVAFVTLWFWKIVFGIIKSMLNLE